MKNGGPPDRAWFRQGNCKPCKVRTTKYLVGIGTPPTPLPQASVPSAPPDQKGGAPRLRLKGWGSPNYDDWRKGLALCLLCGENQWLFVDRCWCESCKEFAAKEITRPYKRQKLKRFETTRLQFGNC
jgi:hypothetical protein